MFMCLYNQHRWPDWKFLGIDGGLSLFGIKAFIAPRAPEPEGRPRGGHAYPELNRRTKRSLIAGVGDCGQ